jgi:hypothetical protein
MVQTSRREGPVRRLDSALFTTAFGLPCLFAIALAPGHAGGSVFAAQGAQPWMQSFPVDVRELVTVGENPYFILKPGLQLTLQGSEGGKGTVLVMTVLAETENVGGVETRVVEERETAGGVLAEVSRNFFAIHPATTDVYYFGEDVDIYKNGKIRSHDGAWRHGSNNAHFGLMMPGAPVVGMRHYQELAPKVAMDRVEIVSLGARSTTPAGVFDNCLKVRETTPLEPLARETKVYARGIGIVEDGSLKLVSHKVVPVARR